jgi:hypothetical protein
MDVCPHCKDDLGFYITIQVTGFAREGRTWDGKKSVDVNMWDAVKYGKESKFRRCINCGKRAGENKPT